MGTPATGVEGPAGVEVVGGFESDVGVSGLDAGDGDTVVGGMDVVWTTVVGPLDEGASVLDVKEKGVEGARGLDEGTDLISIPDENLGLVVLYILVLLAMVSVSLTRS